MDIKEQIVAANAAYRAGNPIMTDQEYDDLLDSLKPTMSDEDYEEFVSSLNEGGIERNIDGKIKHPFTLGSLEKLKAEEPEIVKKWIKENIKTSLSVSAKVDGISSRAQYANGRLVSLTTRGDGYFGQDITSKAKYIKGLPSKLKDAFTGNIRGELVILKNDFESIKNDFANRRNAVAGAVNRKEWSSALDLVSFIPYTILGDEFDKETQFRVLENLGFNVARNFIIKKSDIGDTIIDILFNEANVDLDYDTDGLVISDVEYRNENEYRPYAQKAFKINQSIKTTKIIGFDWGTPSANGKMTPVALLEPVEIAGVIVKRVTCNNITWIENMGVEIGKTVKVMRSGEVIPKIIEVLD